jgi:C-terminal processing protease CtpA/Prc
MKKRTLLYTLLITMALYARAQNLNKSDLLADLQFLNKAIVKAHPTQIRYPNPALLDSITRIINTNAPESMSYRDYEYYIRRALMQVGCMHTYIKPRKAKSNTKPYFFPVNLFASGDSLYVSESPEDSLKYQFRKGDRVLSIQEKPAPDIIHELIQYQPVDGKSWAFGYRLLNYKARILLTRKFGRDSVFTVKLMTKNGIKEEHWSNTLKVVKQTRVQKDTTHYTFKSKGLTFHYINSATACIKISSFNKKGYKKFYKKVFQELNSKKTTALIIDIRDNLGGNRFNASKLLSYLIKEDIKYDIVRANGKMMRYLNFPNKLKFGSSYLYYDLAHLHLRSKTKNGLVQFHCQIKKQKTGFEGQTVVLANGYSTSSSVILASNLRHHANNVTIIGEQTGGGESGINGGSYPTLVLPKSKIVIQTSTYHFQFNNKANNRNGLMPDIPVTYNSTNFFTEDLELKAALDYLKNTKQH